MPPSNRIPAPIAVIILHEIRNRPGARVVPTRSGDAMPEDMGIILTRHWPAARCGLRTIRAPKNRRAEHRQPRFALAKSPALSHFLAMESHELLREIFDQKPPKEVSADLELSTSMIYKWAQPRAAAWKTRSTASRRFTKAPVTSGSCNGFASAPAASSS
jgi:hypothetical protein